MADVGWVVALPTQGAFRKALWEVAPKFLARNFGIGPAAQVALAPLYPLAEAFAVKKVTEQWQEMVDDQMCLADPELAEATELPAASASEPGVVIGDGPAPLQPGDRVYVPGLNAEGEIVSMNDSQAEVQLGRLRVRVKLDDLSWRGSPQPTRPQSDAAVRAPHPASPGLELHLRGQVVEDALVDMDRYLDTAYLAGLPWVRIVHGKGSGKLRRAVREALKHHPLVETYDKAPEHEGGDGVTLVRLVPGG